MAHSALLAVPPHVTSQTDRDIPTGLCTEENNLQLKKKERNGEKLRSNSQIKATQVSYLKHNCCI